MDVPNDCQDPIIQCTTSFGKERSRFHSSLANFGDLIPSKTVLVCIFLSFFHRSSLILILIKPNARSIPIVNALRLALCPARSLRGTGGWDARTPLLQNPLQAK